MRSSRSGGNMASSSLATSNKNYNDKELKDLGNKHFSLRQYDAAVDCYTKAILKNPTVPHYYTNRALCFLNKKQWNQAVQDSKQALERDPSLVKGHFYLGEFNVNDIYISSRRWPPP